MRKYQRYYPLYGERMNWISVKDKLPADQSPVLAFCGKAYRVCSYSCEGWSVCGTYHEIDYSDEDWNYDLVFIKVTHWMPLPEPPHE